MNKEGLKNYSKALLYLLIYVAFSSAIIYFNLNRRYLIFNAGLAFIPYILSVFALGHKNNAIILFFALIIIILFFPNQAYMFTDLIHIRTKEYYTFSGGQVSYIQDYTHWIKLSCDSILVVLGLVLSFETYINILKLIRCYGYKFASFLILIFLSLASGLAIYIGRFLRLNSWDILKINSILKNLIENGSQNDYNLIIIFSIMQFVLLIIFANLRRK